MNTALTALQAGATVQQPLCILIAALGGEGGGVLAEWLVEAATRAGLPVQGTSVPGVAQRTGATSYYFECLPQPAPPGKQPVFALMPVPGRVDIVLASELLEATRMVERGFITPGRTLLITARHRVLTTAEKMAMADGRFDDDKLLAATQALSQHCLALDLLAITARHRTVISAVLFGALAGSGRLPWPRTVCEQVIRDGGLGVDASLAGFAEAFGLAASAMPAADSAAAPSAAATRAAITTATSTAVTAGAQPAVAPPSPTLPELLALGEARLSDYQDAAYAARYRERMAALSATGGDGQALGTAARHLALWMSYEDVVRVADLKTRRERFERVRAEAGAGPDDLLQIHEHLKPGLDEMAAIAPRRLGLWLRQRVKRDAPVGTRGKGVQLHTTSVRGFLALRLLAALKPLRRASLRFAEEDAAIEAWLAALRQVLPANAAFAQALADLPRLRKGYSDTFERGRAAYEQIFAACVVPHLAAPLSAGALAAAAPGLRQAITAALADADHGALHQQLGQAPGPANTLNQGQPVHFHPRVSQPVGRPPHGR